MYTRMRAAIVALGVGVGLVPFSFVLAAGSATVQSLSSSNAIVGTAVTFSVVASGFTNPTYSMSDSFNGGSNIPNNLNSSTGAFSWTPTSGDIGEHDLTITVVDSQGNYASIVQPIYVNSAVSTSLAASAVSPSTIMSPGSEVSFSVLPTGFNAGVTYAVSDSFSGSSVSANTISNIGGFAWTPTVADGGTHTITVTATDPANHSASASVTIVVSQTPTVSVSSLSASTTIVGTPVTFTATASGFSTTTPAFYAVTDYFGGSSLNSSAINASTGAFSWTPTVNDIGTHTVIVRGYDAANNNATTNLVLTIVSSTTPATVAATSSAAIGSATKPALTSTQISAILSLLSSFSVPQNTIDTVSAILNGQTVPNAGAGTAASGFVFTNFLNKGSTGDEVLELQKRLVAAGFLTVEPTGYYGEATFAAVKAFQAAHGLDQFGYVGPGTRAALNGQ